ncbi:hypothetical protein CEE39_09615, partial [bacterium (candidate division B38) B3_B38]
LSQEPLQRVVELNIGKDIPSLKVTLPFVPSANNAEDTIITQQATIKILIVFIYISPSLYLLA